ncbi:MAG: Smr/MutS family protein [Candidatus Gracilibacteria bacterium]|nr:Smr/MutS family protein [Candidatus Gracilibacteria bacterium]
MGKKRNKDLRQQGNKYAHLSGPQDVLDYHDMGILTQDDIQNIAEDFLQKCKDKGARKALIITGKGIHSMNGPVIGPTLRRYLPRLATVHSVQTARRDRGGEGALEVELR